MGGAGTGANGYVDINTILIMQLNEAKILCSIHVEGVAQRSAWQRELTITSL